ncbi:MAG: hypothetical protein Q7S87_01370 [Agitococcus sp.]|nr:hypothetical protein [Agitococcus sp.]MDO9177128.1 hypothetical protein [Agitococcus sp.]
MSICRKITIVVRGDTASDFEEAFNAAVEDLSAGCATGNYRDETSAYSFKNEANVPKEEVPA